MVFICCPIEAVAQMCSVKKVFLEISQENTSARVSFLIRLQGEKEILAKVFSCEFRKISKNIFSYITTPVVAYGPRKIICCLRQWERLR